MRFYKTFELSAHFAPKNIKNQTFLSQFYKKDRSISSKKRKRLLLTILSHHTIHQRIQVLLIVLFPGAADGEDR